MRRRAAVVLALVALLLLLAVPVHAIEVLSQEEALHVLARQIAYEAGIDPDVLECFVTQESQWNPRAVSSRGAQGLVQIVPRWHPGVNPWDEEQSLRYAAAHIAAGLDEFGRYDLALASWNAGTGTVRAVGVPDYVETRTFVSTILLCAAAQKEG